MIISTYAGRRKWDGWVQVPAPVQAAPTTGKRVWDGRLEDYPLENYPDYAPGKPPRVADRLHQTSFLDEVELIWGKRWGSQGIGRLREVMLVKPTEHESNPLFAKAPEFFLLRHGIPDWRRILDNILAYAEILESHGVKVHWMEFEDIMGAYGPMRKLFIAAEPRIVRGGAILPRCGHGSYKRGLEREFQKFLTKIGCPILLTISGDGFFESGTLLNVAENVMVGTLSCANSWDGFEQMVPVLSRCGVAEVHLGQSTTILESFESGGEFHLDMAFGMVDHKLALVYPAQLDWSTFSWLKSKGFRFIEVPPDEQHLYAPCNGVMLEPGLVVMAKEAKKTIQAVRQAGIEVVELDTSGLIQGGTNGINCCTDVLLRDPGPTVDDPAPRRNLG